MLNPAEKNSALSLMQDVTSTLQSLISESCKNLSGADPTSIATLQLEKGDYAVSLLQIPRNGRVLLFSKDRVRLLFSGKRNRPMFVLEENSVLVLREKIEIYYNTNNLQEVSKLMVRCPKSSRVEISKDVKISLFSMKQG